MNLREYRAFSTELMKLASGILDHDVRILLADRRGEEYLQGGQLPSNHPSETNFTPKIASLGRAVNYSNLGNEIHSGKRVKNKSTGGLERGYMAGREYLGALHKGLMTGVGTIGTGTLITGGRSPSKNLTRAGAVVGAGTAIGDLLARRHFSDQRAHQKVAMVVDNPNASFGSPAKALADSRKVGSFQPGRIHTVRPQIPKI
jgi:hypothetical protein